MQHPSNELPTRTIPHEESQSSVSGFDPEAPQVNAKQLAAAEERRTLGKKESCAIFLLRFVVIALLFAVGVGSSLSVYFLAIDEGVDNFRTEFGFFGRQVIDKLNSAIERKLGALDSLSIEVTSHAIESGEEFPFVTTPHFEYKGSNSRIAGDTLLTLYLPIVTEENRPQWESYASNHSFHIAESYDREQRAKSMQDESYGLNQSTISDALLAVLAQGDDFGDMDYHIFYPEGGNANDEPQSIYFPVWQVTPSIPPEVQFFNMDFSQYAFSNNSIMRTVQTGEACLDFASDLISDDGDITDALVFEVMIQSGQFRHSTEHYLGDPLSFLSYPVFGSFEEGKQVVGVIFSTLYWRLLFSNILPSNIYGIVCVLENTAGQVYSYELDRGEARYLGKGDFHDSQYDYLRESIDIATYMQENSSPETRSFTAVELHHDYLNYTLSIYPTNSFKDIYVTSEAFEEAIGVAVTFATVIVVFLLYDCCVQRRQRIVMDRAVKATAVVGSLYPDTVREQILNDGVNEKQSRSLDRTFMRKSVESVKKSHPSGPPIASKYPNCTVYFADLVGFTKWSSTREPEQVFELLEALFREFDLCALRRSVFKVETIGDCYMAVTGLPQAQSDHAVKMAKFAHDCMLKLEQVTIELSNSLGQGTDELALRSGMHSGEVTAGVLRGEKGRFQLFGDTVNTASRMESTGVPRMIQVSQSTADELILQGHEAWLVPRETKVHAKGKGEMQTYFIQIKDKSDKSQTASSSEDAKVMKDSL